MGFAAALCCLLWGSAFPYIKIGYTCFDIGQGDWQTQILFAGIRFLLAGALVILIGSIINKKFLLPHRGSVKNIAVLSIFQTILQYVLFYIALAHTTGTKASVINSAGVFLAVIVASLVFRQERLNLSKVAGCLLGLAGVIIINLSQGGFAGSISFLGEGFVLLSALSYAISSALIKQYGKTENPVTLSGWQFMLGGLVMALTGLIAGGRLKSISPKGVIVLLYLAMLSAVAYTLWGILLKHNSVSSVAVFGFLTPLFGFVLSALMLKEGFGNNIIKTIISLVLVSVGIIIVNREIIYESKNDSCKGI